MKRHVGNSGFTIVETMIVLAVTGALFVAIAATLSGRQSSNEFIQSINDARTRLQQVITETQNGFYASKGDFNCSGGASISLSAVSPANQGENNDCVFLGKIMQFAEQGAPASQVRVYPVTALRSATSLATADPSVLSNGSVDESTTFDLKYGLTVDKTRVVGGAQNIGAFGVLSTLDSTNPGQSGDQRFDVYAFSGISLNHAKLADSTNLLSSYVVNPSSGFQICFKSGSTKQYGLITIGNKNSQLSVDLNIMDSVCW